MGGKGTRAHTAQDIKRSKELPVGEEVPRTSTDDPTTDLRRTNHTDVAIGTPRDTTLVDLGNLANHSSDLTMIANKTKPTPFEPNTSAHQDSRFESWTHLCLGTERRYPDPNDAFRSTNYARRPR